MVASDTGARPPRSIALSNARGSLQRDIEIAPIYLQVRLRRELREIACPFAFTQISEGLFSIRARLRRQETLCSFQASTAEELDVQAGTKIHTRSLRVPDSEDVFENSPAKQLDTAEERQVIFARSAGRGLRRSAAQTRGPAIGVTNSPKRRCAPAPS